MGLCKTRVLQQENYGGTYGFDVLLGKANYPCASPYSDGDTADDCPYDDMNDCPDKKECEYWVQKKIVRSSNKASLNYSLYLCSRFPKTDPPDVLFMDEAHLLSDIVLSWVGCRIRTEECRSFYLGTPPEIKPSVGLSLFQRHDPAQMAIGWLSGALNSLGRQIASLKRHPERADAKKRLARGLNLQRSLTATKEAIEDNPTDWHIQSGHDALEGRRGKEGGFMAKPLTARYHFNRLFLHSPTTICMSGTIGSFETFAEELGIKDYAERRVPSQYPPEVRPVYDLDCPNLNWKSTEADFNQQADIIAKAIMDCPKEWSGVLHVTRKKEAIVLAERLAHRGLQDRVWPTPDLPTDQQMVAWADQKAKANGYGGQLAITWAWREGVDLRNEKICIVAKVPFSDTSDPYEAARAVYSRPFYLQRAAWDAEQALGRTRRGDDEDYDTDEQKNQLVCLADSAWRRVKPYFSESFRESIVEP